MGIQVFGKLEGFFDLANNLKVPQDFGLQAGAYAKQVLNGFAILVDALIFFEALYGLSGVLAKEADELARAVGKGVNFGPITGGEDHHTIASFLLIVVDQVADLLFTEAKPFADFYGGLIVVDPDQEEVGKFAYLVVFHNLWAKISRFDQHLYPDWN